MGISMGFFVSDNQIQKRTELLYEGTRGEIVRVSSYPQANSESSRRGPEKAGLLEV